MKPTPYQIILMVNYLENVHGRMIAQVETGLGDMTLLDQELDLFMTNYDLPAGTIEEVQAALIAQLNNPEDLEG